MRAPRQPKKPRRITPSSPVERDGGGELTQRPITHQDYIPTAPAAPLEDVDEVEWDDPAPQPANEPDDEAGDETNDEAGATRSDRRSVGTSVQRWSARASSGLLAMRGRFQPRTTGPDTLSLDARREERRRERRTVVLKRAGIGAAFVTLLVFIGWLVLASPLFRYQYVAEQITGYSQASIVDRAQVEGLVAKHNGDNLLLLDTGDIERAIVKAIPEVASVKITKDYPRALAITITEAVPVACVGAADRCTAVTAEGESLQVPADIAQSLPRIGKVADGIDQSRAVKDALGVLGVLPAAVLQQVSQAEIANGDLVTLILSDGRKVYWGGLERAEFKAKVLAVLLSQPAKFYDVSVPQAPVSR